MNRVENRLANPLVSVVIPAFNAEPFIERTLLSVLGQTYSNLQIIIVNDGSTDATLQIAERFAASDRRLEVITTVNQGVAAARNTGIDHARGDFLAFVDADDLWHPTKIAKQLAKLQDKGPEWGGVYTWHRVIDYNDYIIQDGITSTTSGYMLGQHLVVKFVRNGSTLLVRREAAIAVGGFEPAYAAQGIGGCEDLDFELRIAAKYKMDVVPEFLVGYRRYSGNMSSGRVRMARSLLAVVDKCLASNPHLSGKTRDLALLAAHEYAFMNFTNGRDVKRALASFATIARYDLFSAAYILMAVIFFHFPRRLIRTLVKNAGWNWSTLHEPARKYSEMGPLDNAETPLPWSVRQRLGVLKELDADYERRNFGSGPG